MNEIGGRQSASTCTTIEIKKVDANETSLYSVCNRNGHQAGLRGPLAGFEELNFTSKTPDPFKVEKRTVSAKATDMNLFYRSALHGNYSVVTTVPFF
jgi:hypothetical protein